MAGLHFDITGDNSNFMRKLEETRNGVINTSKRIEESGMSIEQMFGRMTKAAAAFGAGFSAQQFASQVMKVRGEFQQLEVAFNTMLGSKEKADTLMSQLVRTAAITPFDLQGVANGAKQLLAYGTSAEDVNGTLVRLGDIAAGLSIPLGDLVYLYGTTMTQGRLFTQDLRQFQGRGIPLADELAKQFGVTKDKVGELVTAGKIGFPEVQKAIEAMTNEGGKFGGLMEAQSKTITGQISNIEDAISTMFNEIGKSNEGIINSALSGVSYLVEHWEDVAIAIESAAIAYGTYKAAVMTTAALQGAEQILKVDTEIEGLKSLLVVKEESKNVDIAAAVASGRLTEAKAAELVSLREELATRLTVLKLKEEEAIAEHASALSAFNTAKQVSDAANERLEKMDALYQAALSQGDASYEQYAMEQLQTASANANTAATTLNTAEKNLNAASSKRKVASEAVDTMATQANTVANHANTASMNIMKLAGIQLTTMLKAMWATLMANPLLLVAGAVIGLGFAVYKLATAETEAEKATRMYNEALDEQQKKQEEYKEKIDVLIKTIDDNNKSEGERLQAFEALKAEYPTVLNNLLTEAEYLKDVLKYKRLIAKEDNNRAKKSDEEILEEAKRKLKYYQEVRKNGTSTTLVDMDGNGWATDNVETAIMKQQKIVNQAIAKVASHNVAFYMGNIKNMKDDDIVSVIDGINTSLRALGKSGEDAIAIVAELGGEFSKSQLSTIKSALETEQNARNAEKNTGKEWIEKYKKAYLNAKDELDKFLNSKNELSEIEYERKLKELTDKKDEAEKKYKASGGKVTTDKQTQSEADKLRQEQEKYKLLVSKQELEHMRTNEDLQIQTDQARINAMKDGSARTLEQMKLDHKKEMQQLERQKEDFLRKKIEVAKAVFDSKEDEKAGKDINYKKRTFDGSNITLSRSEKNAFDNQKMHLDLKQSSEMQAYLDKERQAWNDYLAEYGAFQEKKEAITSQYNEKISNASTKGEKESLKKEKESKLKEVNFEKLKSSINFADIFGDLDAQSTDAIKVLRDKLKEIINKSAKDLSPTDLKSLQDALGNINLKMAERDPFGELKQGIEKYKTSTLSVIKAQEDLNTVQQGGEVIVGTYIDSTGKIISKLLTQEQAEKNLSRAQSERQSTLENLTKSANSIGAKGMEVVNAGNQVVDMLENFGVAVPEAIGKTLDGLGQTMSALESIDITKPFSAITGSIGVLTGIGNTIAGIFGFGNRDKKHEKNIQRMQDQIEVLEKTYEKLGDSIEKAYSKDATKLINQQNTLLEQQKVLIQNQIKEEKDKKKTDWGRIKEWEGQIDEINKLIEDNKEKAVDAIFGEDLKNAIDNFASAYADAWTSGEDKAKSAKDVVKNMMRQMVTESIKSAIQSSKAMEAIRKKLQEFYADNVLSGWEQNYIYGMAENLQKELDKQFGWADNLMKDEDVSTSQSSTKGYSASMSQDTGEELNGRFTAFQISNEEIKNAMLSMLVYVNLISVSVNNNSITLIEIKNLMIASNGYLEDIAKYTKELIGFKQIITNIENSAKSMAGK